GQVKGEVVHSDDAVAQFVTATDDFVFIVADAARSMDCLGNIPHVCLGIVIQPAALLELANLAVYRFGLQGGGQRRLDSADRILGVLWYVAITSQAVTRGAGPDQQARDGLPQLVGGRAQALT